MIPEAVPSPGAIFARVRDLTDDYLVVTIDPDGSTVWRRVDQITRESIGDAVCEARYEPERVVLIRLPFDVVERLANSEDDDDDLLTVRQAALQTWGGL